MIKDIMVWLDGSLSDEVRLAASAEIARRFENQVIRLFVNPLPLPGPVPGNVGALATADLTERAREAGGQDGGEAGQAPRPPGAARSRFDDSMCWLMTSPTLRPARLAPQTHSSR